MNEAAPLIVSLEMDESSFRVLNGMRQAHFPAERNFLDAHITLFHHLPGSERAAVERALARMAQSYSPPLLKFSGLRFLGRGVAVDYDSPPLTSAHRELAQAFSAWLTPQDKQKFRAHVTVQNKAEPAAIKALLAELKASFSPFPVLGKGFLLWRYLGGPWEKLGSFLFAEGRAEK